LPIENLRAKECVAINRLDGNTRGQSPLEVLRHEALERTTGNFFGAVQGARRPHRSKDAAIEPEELRVVGKAAFCPFGKDRQAPEMM
jgi:hypothetical protein